MQRHLTVEEHQLEREIRRFNVVYGALFPHLEVSVHAELVPKGVAYFIRYFSKSPGLSPSSYFRRGTWTRAEWLSNIEALEGKIASTHEWDVTWGHWRARENSRSGYSGSASHSGPR